MTELRRAFTLGGEREGRGAKGLFSCPFKGKIERKKHAHHSWWREGGGGWGIFVDYKKKGFIRMKRGRCV